MVEIWVCLYMCASCNSLLGCYPFPLLAVEVQDVQGQQSCLFPLNFILFCQIRECMKDKKDEGIEDEIREKEGLA